MIKRFLILFLIIVATSGCSEDTITEPNSDLIVVTGFLRAGEKNAEIKLTNVLALGSADTISAPVNDAEVILFKRNKSYKLNVNPAFNGVYSYAGNDLIVESGDLFSLQINHKNKKN